jgi:hypothetical protein
MNLPIAEAVEVDIRTDAIGSFGEGNEITYNSGTADTMIG